MINILTSFLSCIISSLIVFNFLENFFDRKFKYHLFYYFIALTMLMFVANLLQNTYINYLATFLYFFIASRFLYKSENKNIYLITFILIFVLMIIEAFSFIFVTAIFSTDKISELSYAMKAIVSLIITLLVYFLLINNTKGKLIEAKKFSFVDGIFLGFNLGCTFLIVYLADRTSDYTILFIYFILTLCILLSSIYIVFILNLRYKYQRLKQGYEMSILEANIKVNTYKNKMIQIEKEEKYMHDLKNHLNVLTQMYESKDYEKAKSYNQSLIDNIAIQDRIISNDFIQIMLVDFKPLCDKEKIKLDININKLVSFERFDDIDVVTMFSNLLSNAYEATLESKINDKTIRIQIQIVNNFIIIIISNPFCKINISNRYLFHSTKVNHKGYGIENIKDVIEKYDGTYQIDTSNNKFLFQINLPIEGD